MALWRAVNSHFNISCPLHAGTHLVTNSLTIPSMMPVGAYFLSRRVCMRSRRDLTRSNSIVLPAPYFARIRAFTAKDEEIGCLEIMAQLSDAN